MKYYFITYRYRQHMSSTEMFQDEFIDIHPLEFRKKNRWGTSSRREFGEPIILINWMEITEEEYNLYK